MSQLLSSIQHIGFRKTLGSNTGGRQTCFLPRDPSNLDTLLPTSFACVLYPSDNDENEAGQGASIVFHVFGMKISNVGSDPVFQLCSCVLNKLYPLAGSNIEFLLKMCFLKILKLSVAIASIPAWACCDYQADEKFALQQVFEKCNSKQSILTFSAKVYTSCPPMYQALPSTQCSNMGSKLAPPGNWKRCRTF